MTQTKEGAKKAFQSAVAHYGVDARGRSLARRKAGIAASTNRRRSAEGKWLPNQTTLEAKTIQASFQSSVSGLSTTSLSEKPRSDQDERSGLESSGSRRYSSLRVRIRNSKVVEAFREHFG